MYRNIQQEVEGRFERSFDEYDQGYAAYDGFNAGDDRRYPESGDGDLQSDPRNKDDDLSPPKRPLEVFNCEELASRCYARKEFLVNGLITTGLTVLAGAPKVGKSWFVLQLCMQIAKGEPFLGLPTKKAGVLYIALEDDERRLQRRMFTMTDELPANCYMTTRCSRISDDEQFEKELAQFYLAHKDVKLIVIDTFQMVREKGRDMSYANDYSEVSTLKNAADFMDVAILLVHHTRKQGDSDYMNEISGTNGIAGSADTLMVLKKEKRNSREANLSYTGRDIEDREMTLRMDRETCTWEQTYDSLADMTEEVPEEITELVAFMKDRKIFVGSNADFTQAFMDERRFIIDTGQLKKAMNRYRYELKDLGVSFEDYREKNTRCVKIRYEEPK